MIVAFLAALGGACWVAVLLLPWQPWRTRERIEPGDRDVSFDLSDITALIPARDEADMIAGTLAALRSQGPGLAAVVLDDQSSDGTANVAAHAWPGVTIEQGKPLPEGWSGKLWALAQARRHAKTRHLLLLDADIRLEPGMVRALKAKLDGEDRDLVSVMAALRMESFWERLLMPAFIFFFKLLYPFGLANGPNRWVAAAAGGCILIRAETLDGIGGFEALRDALIDDCTLARLVKRRGGRTWIGLSHAVRSMRSYDRLGAIWNMVARTAFTQLFYSPLLLGLCTLFLVATMWGPLAGVAIWPSWWVGWASAAGLGAMMAAYLPVLRYYGRSPLWVLLMPVIGTLYLLMTWTSAIRYWRGARSNWKGRRDDVAPAPSVPESVDQN